MADHDGFLSSSRLSIILIGIGSAAFVVSVYHCIAVGWCNRQRSNPTTPPPARPFMPEMAEISRNSVEFSTAELIPAHKYKKGAGLVGDDGMCAVCLCEYEEGEELRTLPECLHSYHAPCIDMWLHSHPNCPMCRTDATVLSPQRLQPPPPPLPPQQPDLGSENLRANIALQNFVQSSAIFC